MSSHFQSSTTPKPVIFGCSGPSLTPEERDFFKRSHPLGFILFSRNCQTPSQIRDLISQLRECVPHKTIPILIDQEGGRVARLRPPYWRDYPPYSVFGKLFKDNPEKAIWATKINSFILAQELRELGITVNCAPVADLTLPGSHPIISDRSFSQDPLTVITLCLAVMEGFKVAGITPILKHLPGHGHATVDSHEELPFVALPLDHLCATDFSVFQQVCAHFSLSPSFYWGMTAHIVFSKIDSFCTTHSPIIIDSIIRNHIGFKGFLVSDCLTMKALTGSYGQRAADALKAGCNAVLHCSGNLEEMIDVISALPPLSFESEELLKQSVSLPKEQDILCTIPLSTLEKQLHSLLKPYWTPAVSP